MTTPSQRDAPSFLKWLDNSHVTRTEKPSAGEYRVDWFRCVPFVLIHLACLTVLIVGFSWTALVIAVGLYLVRMFAITGFYHRYFSHRAFKTSRTFQFMMALAGCSAGQRGPIWWSAHHRHHHVHSDHEPDIHSPGQHGFWQSHMGWFMTPAGFRTREEYTKDWIRFPELRFLDRFDWIAPLGLGLAVFVAGVLLAKFAPQLGTNGWQLLVWFVISTVFLYHATYTINSLAHVIGRQRYDTGDDSRNNLALALLTLGEGWHNNHHHYPAAARQGFYWWEIDLSYYALRVLAWSRLIWDLRPVPRETRESNQLSAKS